MLTTNAANAKNNASFLLIFFIGTPPGVSADISFLSRNIMSRMTDIIYTISFISIANPAQTFKNKL